MDVRVLGPLEVERDGRLLNLGGAKQRSVLAVLVIHAREVISTDRLADEVWAGAPPPSADTTLRAYLSNLRKALEPDRGPDEPPQIVRRTSAGYVLDVTDEQIDARRFEGLVSHGRGRLASGDAATAAGAWSQALALWRGEAFQDLAYCAFAQVEARRLEDLRLACAEDLFEAQLQLGRHDAVVGDLDAFCASHPERERALRLKMLALYRCGRQTEALTAYEQGRRRLADELGLDPSPELRALHEQIIRQDEHLAATASYSSSVKQTLTFLLGDVERSTEKLRALGEDYPAVLEEHRRMLKEALSSHGGRAVRMAADEVFAAFDCATDAIAAAVAAQRALSTSELDEGQRLPVRMGLHTGEATLSQGEYVGLAVHLAARIMAAAHGGQILISQATKELFEAEEGVTVGLLDTGLHKLKDIPDAVRLHQVVHPALRRDFPPLLTRAGRTDNLPTALTSFVGRERDVEEIAETLAEARVVTLTGVGGVGKTRLAVEVGNRLVARYPDGVWLCELAPIGDGDSIVHRMATTLGVEQQPGRSMRESLLAALAQRESLLILDNCEHLLQPVAELIEDILDTTRTTDILATSREAIGVHGERSRPVPSLAVTADEETADAMRLFEDRAQAVRPDFTLDEANASTVARVCARLDGIPLAIELAAARVTSMSPAQIAARLEAGFHFLRSGRRAAVDRHRTLHGAIDWSYALLSEPEKLLFDRLSVFAGGFTLEAAEEVCGRGLELDVADGLASLVAKSMVDADVTGEQARYSLLETMRQYGQDRLAQREEADEILRAHAMYFARVFGRAPDFVHGDSERVVRQLLVELDNVRAAQEWARSAGDVDLALRIAAGDPALMRFVGLSLREVSGWAEEAIALPGAEDHELLPVVLVEASTVALFGGDPTRGDELLVRALELIDDPDDPRRLGALSLRSGWSVTQGRLDEARLWNAEFLRVARVNDDLPRQISSHGFGSLIESAARDHAAALELAEAGYALSRTGSSALQGFALYFLGDALNQSGQDLERALDCLDRSVALCRANEMHFWVGVALVSLASLRARHGDPLEALRMFDDIIDHWRRSGDWGRQWVTIRNLSELFGRIGADAAAAALLAASEGSGTAPPIFGPQAERIAKLRHELCERMGDDAFVAACERGRAMSDEDALAYAKAEIDRALERSAGRR